MNMQVALQALSSTPMRWVAASACLSCAIGLAVPGEAAVISATAQGSLTPPTTSFPDPLTNGDFSIAPNPGATDKPVGDGGDEETTWTLDFTTDPGFSDFSTSDPLTSALLTLTLSTCCDVATDRLKISGLPAFETDLFTGLPPETTQTIDLNLLDFYSSNQILDALSPTGTLAFKYEDDALVSFAQLELRNNSAQSVPEPFSPLSAIAIAVLGGSWKRFGGHQTRRSR